MNQEIIKLLEVDGRMAFKEIAQQLGVSEGTIRNRVSGLRANNQLRIVAMADPAAAEYTTDAMIGLKVASGVTPRQVAERLGADPHVVFILWVAGQYDLIIEIVSNNNEALKDFLENEIHAYDDISDADVMLGIVNFKNQFLLKRNKSKPDHH
ncbi:Lrp/AsnC family transcriptional regulator [Roseovarius sp. 2305UL8-3]|uniref:Lrp/AsnC family transcriptional regulator n=1 Tax=Roseovarius conchicola TaxID=3121636 RepID=UPI00352794CF